MKRGRKKSTKVKTTTKLTKKRGRKTKKGKTITLNLTQIRNIIIVFAVLVFLVIICLVEKFVFNSKKVATNSEIVVTSESVVDDTNKHIISGGPIIQENNIIEPTALKQ